MLAVDPTVHEHLRISGDRLGHRDAGGERGLLQAEDVVVPRRPGAIPVQLLHREGPSIGVETIGPVRRLAGHPGHRSERGPEMIEVHPTTAARTERGNREVMVRMESKCRVRAHRSWFEYSASADAHDLAASDLRQA